MANPSTDWRPRRIIPLPTADARDALFAVAAGRRSNQIYPEDGLLWSPWDDPNDIPPTPGAPRMRCIPLPDVEELAVPTTTPARRRRGHATSHAQLHPALGRTLAYDLTRGPEEAYVVPSSSALGLFFMSPDPSLSWQHDPQPSSSSPFSSSSSSPSSSSSSSSSTSASSSAHVDPSFLPYDEPATQPTTRTLLIDVGPHQDVPIIASNDAYVTCWDVIAQLYAFLSLPLDDPYALDVRLDRVVEAYQAREREAAQHQRQRQGRRRDVLRNVDALMGETEWDVMTPRGSGGKWVVKTRRPVGFH